MGGDHLHGPEAVPQDPRSWPGARLQREVRLHLVRGCRRGHEQGQLQVPRHQLCRQHRPPGHGLEQKLASEALLQLLVSFKEKIKI